jgi:ABC-2 type transport system permease protein
VSRTWLRQLRALLGKELLQLVRDRVLFVFILYVFTLNIVSAAGEVGTELSRATLVVHDADRTAASRELVDRFRLPYFRFGGEVDVRAGLAMLDRGDALLLVVVPERFEETLLRGAEPARLQVLIDTSNANDGYLAAAYSARIAADLGRDWVERRLARGGGGALPAIEDRRRVRYNPALDETWFGTLSELLSMLTFTCLLLPAAATVREKERGTMEQLLVSPVDAAQVMLAKVLATSLVALAGTALALFGIMQPLYAVPARGSLVLFFALTLLYTFTNAGLGLVASTFTRKTGQVGLIVVLIVMPILMLSGIRTPWETMPAWLRAVMSFSPLHHYIDVTYGILLRGAGLDTLWDSILAMGALGAALFALGAWRFRAQFR